MNSAARCLVVLSFFHATLLSGCNSYDSDYIPFGITGMDVYVYDDRTNKEYFGGRVKGNYFSRRPLRGKCEALAYDVAREHHLEDWSFICCTVTSSSSCVTKVN